MAFASAPGRATQTARRSPTSTASIPTRTRPRSSRPLGRICWHCWAGPDRGSWSTCSSVVPSSCPSRPALETTTSLVVGLPLASVLVKPLTCSRNPPVRTGAPRRCPDPSSQFRDGGSKSFGHNARQEPDILRQARADRSWPGPGRLQTHSYGCTVSLRDGSCSCDRRRSEPMPPRPAVPWFGRRSIRGAAQGSSRAQ